MNRINEIGDTPKGQYALGQLAGKYEKMTNDTKIGTKAHRKAKGKMWGMRQYANATPHKKGDDFENGHDDYLMKNESKNMNKKLIRLTESDLHKIVKESVNRIINEIGNTDKGQDALGQVRGRADKRSKLLGGAIGNKYRKISRDAQDKAYSQGKKHGFDIYDPNGAYDKGISKGYEKALKESDNWEDNESTIDYWRQAEDNYLMQEKLPRGWEKHKCDDVFGGFIYTDGDYNEYYKDQYGRFQPLDNEF